ncbi:MAG TPA: hypothetical protein RMH99_21550 [Sandaracinaceae bacterium LLY-WYZ-13_1]|nr:hypothetical protein [Sandaracinaceae bacterium LLY-WYZ-13_1]
MLTSRLFRASIALAASLVAVGCEGRLVSTAGGDDPPPVRLMDGGPEERADARVVPGVDAGPPPDPSDPDAGEPPPPPPTDGRDAASVFFVGHSLINFDMPEMLAGIGESGGVRHEWSAHIGNGAPLSWIWSHPERGDGADPHAELPSGRYDVLVLTEAIPLEDQMRYNDTVGYAERFVRLARDGDPNARVYLYETWHSLDGAYDWRARIESDRALWESVMDDVDARVDGPAMRMVPGGTALGRLVDRVEAGGVPGLGSRRDLFVDDIHLGDVGNYFIALVQYATIYQRSPVGVTASTVDRWGEPFAAPSPDAARVMQEIAWEVVSTDPRAGVR